MRWTIWTQQTMPRYTLANPFISTVDKEYIDPSLRAIEPDQGNSIQALAQDDKRERAWRERGRNVVQDKSYLRFRPTLGGWLRKPEWTTWTEWTRWTKWQKAQPGRLCLHISFEMVSYISPRLRMNAGTSRSSCSTVPFTASFTDSRLGFSRVGVVGLAWGTA